MQYKKMLFENSDSSPLNIRPENLGKICEAVLEHLTEDTILGLCFEVHRAVKTNHYFLNEPNGDDGNAIVDEAGVDVFGKAVVKRGYESICPACQRSIDAQYFASHLEKHMGKGRISSRVANQRITNTGKDESDIEEFENDSDCNYSSSQKTSKKKSDKSRRNNKVKGKNGKSVLSTLVEFDNSIMTYDAMTQEQKRSLLLQMCGVVSGRTKKICTRSLKCPQHSEEQKRSIRSSIFGRASLTSA